MVDKAEIAKFREALKNGEVLFSYTKKDGTVREARGTLKAELLPPAKAPTVKFVCTKINWNTDGRGTCNLPECMVIELDEMYVEEELKNDELLEEAIADELSDRSGFCVLDYEYVRREKRAPKKLADGTIFYYDLDKAAFRSFDESQLLSWE